MKNDFINYNRIVNKTIKRNYVNYQENIYLMNHSKLKQLEKRIENLENP